MSYLYCIQCGHMDEVHNGSHRIVEVHQDNWYHWLEWKECQGPFAYDAPPEVETEYPLFERMLIPDADELAIMNENASLLLADMEM